VGAAVAVAVGTTVAVGTAVFVGAVVAVGGTAVGGTAGAVVGATVVAAFEQAARTIANNAIKLINRVVFILLSLYKKIRSRNHSGVPKPIFEPESGFVN